MNSRQRRSLYIIPIVHSTHDLGMLKESILAGKSDLNDNVLRDEGKLSVDWFWDEMREAIKTWKWDFKQTYIFQDALPVGPDDTASLEVKIVSDLAAQGNPNYIILRWLHSQGAQLVGTEDPKLLLEEYQLVRQTLENPATKLPSGDETTKELLKRRDAFIAERINRKLPGDGIGLVFLGMLHRIEALLDSDIELHYPFGRPDHETIAVVNNY